ncbi:unnamed protein product [Aphanomyces euteiches]|uniref:FYVE-type domain-containing protein n=1 Tax=Aphanomyces euteiches TaxID=100861 RepID=A0A6G0WN94_9STRA|nr:hypothetical protein Ae201684_013391 [Aphanomyces euteiches]KAH9062969.1 hypothetical protein Ae201684P_009234 [Aphanomyces euteiches]KAH9156711.1 hypothetical protein AeRB84_001399 [Aphanomyces euteiches]
MPAVSLEEDQELAESFHRAEDVVATLLSRLHCDPIAVDPAVWPIHNWESLLWALQQQVHHGPCEDCRGQDMYADILAEHKYAPHHWYACCATRLGKESHIKKWELLGSMSPIDAATKYIDIVNEVVPGWNASYDADVALLTEWTADGAAHCCSNCNQGFTLLNRRHHCRRCSRLVCAPCSSNRLGLRLFPGLPQKMQRVCDGCVSDMSPLVLTALAKGLALPPPPPSQSLQPSHSVNLDPAELTDEQAKPEVKKAISKQNLIKRGYLERMVGSRFQKRWEKLFFVLLVRKGSIGIYTHEDDMAPIEVYKLGGYSIRVKSEKRRPHQFKVEHATQTPIRLCATSLREMNEWISAFSQAIEACNASDMVRAKESSSSSL